MLEKSPKNLKSKDLSRDEAFKILRDYLTEQRELGVRKLISQEGFESPSWSEQHAYNLGFIKAVEKLKTFIPDQGTNA